MADSLILKGVKDVRKHTGTEMQLTIPKRGGDVHQIKRWWQKGVSTVYCACSVFNVSTGGGNVKLVIASGKGESATVRIDHDGNGKFTFSHINELERAAVFTDDWQLIEHYIFPAIAGGSIVTVTPPGGGAAPAPATTISNVSVSGETGPTNGDTETYTANVTGTASDITYTWGVGAGGTVDSGQGTSQATITWSSDGPNGVTCVAGSNDPNFDGNTESFTLSINVAVLFSALVAGADLSVAVTVADTGNGNKYQIDGVEQDSIVATVGSTIHFDLSDASLSGHPFKIYTDSSKTTEVTVGVSQEGTDLLFTPPIAGSFSYQCGAHANMGGDITVS